MNQTAYTVPIGITRIETTVSNSRFITTITRVETVAEARAFLERIRQEMPDASHHVYAFRLGYGSSVIEGMSDDGEPSGTAGPPVLAVLRGSTLGDIILVVTRYFGGTKLGTGGLVRAYGDAARAGLAQVRAEPKIHKTSLGIEIPYALFETIRRFIAQCDGVIDDQIFETDITLFITLPTVHLQAFSAGLIELSAGQVRTVLLE